ncbi:MAG TPA: lytic transglycosylase domain-containing protein [Trinickia sp.]|nr:lytic transglycosylase domain-containing protein [Trinickia sp.]
MSTTKPHHPPGPKHAPAHPTPRPAPAPAPQAPAYVPLKWSYPFTTGDGKDAADAHSFFEALSNAGDGFFPLGANGIWHGGIHFDAATGKILKQEDGVRAIADGEVVAYRLDSQYPVLKYQDGNSCMYSTGFVLVRHKLVLPPAPNAASPASGPTSTPATPPADETLTFFSLYMHLLDWKTYKAAIDAPPPVTDPSKTSNQPAVGAVKCMPYWKGEKRYRVSAGASDTQREQTPFNFPIPDPLRVDPPDSPLLPGGMPGSLDPSAAPLSWPNPLNTPRNPDPSDPFRFDRPPLSNPAPKHPQAKGAQVYSKAKGEPIGLLPQGTEVQLGAATQKDKGWAPITKVIKGEPVGVVVGDPVDARVPTGWVKVDQFELLINPQPLDCVVVLDTPYRIDAGGVIGYLGEYQRYREASKLPPAPQRSLMHLEVFAGPDLPTFIKKSQARAKQLPDQKTFLEISEGATLVDVAEAKETVSGGLLLKPLEKEAADGPWVKVQPTRVTVPAPPKADHSHAHPKHPKVKPIETPEGLPVWVERAVAGKTITTVVKAWRDFPLQISNAKGPAAGFDEVYSRGELDKFGAEAKARDDKNANWWKISVGTADGDSREGWVCGTGHPRVQSHSAWEWPGFELIDITGWSMVDWFKRNLYVFGMLFDGDEESFKPSVLGVNSSDLIKRLEKVADRLGNKDGRVSGEELARAQRVRWVAYAMSHLVVRYESEWGGALDKWEPFTSLMKERKFIWQAEMERIGQLRWWDKAAGVAGLPSASDVYHFHPIGLIESFKSDCACINVEEFCRQYELMHAKDFGWFDDKTGRHISISPLNEASRAGLKALVTEMMRQYSNYFRECRVEYLAYMLATARIESYNWRKSIFFTPIAEDITYEKAEQNYGCGPTADPRHRARAIAHGNTEIGDGYKYRGRGLVQLTWKDGYKKFGDDLVSNPDKVLGYPAAVAIMMKGMRDGLFTHVSLADHLDKSPPDYYHARYIINGDNPPGSGHPDKAEQFEFYAKLFEKLIRDTK